MTIRKIGREKNKLYQDNAQRAFFGKENNGNVVIKLMDSKGRQRIRLLVDKDDIPIMKFLDEKGGVTYKLPLEE